jgi:hypothetical protein
MSDDEEERNSGKAIGGAIVAIGATVGLLWFAGNALRNVKEIRHSNKKLKELFTKNVNGTEVLDKEKYRRHKEGHLKALIWPFQGRDITRSGNFVNSLKFGIGRQSEKGKNYAWDKEMRRRELQESDCYKNSEYVLEDQDAENDLDSNPHRNATSSKPTHQVQTRVFYKKDKKKGEKLEKKLEKYSNKYIALIEKRTEFVKNKSKKKVRKIEKQMDEKKAKIKKIYTDLDKITIEESDSDLYSDSDSSDSDSSEDDDGKVGNVSSRLGSLLRRR